MHIRAVFVAHFFQVVSLVSFHHNKRQSNFFCGADGISWEYFRNC